MRATTLGSAMKLNITIDGKTYEVEVDAAEAGPPAAVPYSAGGLNIGSAPLRVPAGAAPAARLRIREHGSIRAFPRNLTSRNPSQTVRPSLSITKRPPTFAAASGRNRYRSGSSMRVSQKSRIRLSVPCLSATRLAVAHDPRPPENR